MLLAFYIFLPLQKPYCLLLNFILLILFIKRPYMNLHTLLLTIMGLNYATVGIAGATLFSGTILHSKFNLQNKLLSTQYSLSVSCLSISNFLQLFTFYLSPSLRSKMVSPIPSLLIAFPLLTHLHARTMSN